MTTEPMALLEVPPEPHLWIWSVASATEAGSAILGWNEARLVVRTVRGRKMRSVAQLGDEFSAALQFPSYYGENWDAFDECLRDLDGLLPEAGYVIVVTDPLLVLDESPADFEVLVRVLGSAVAEWAKPIDAGEWWDRPAVPFNVVLATDPANMDTVASRWQRAGARLDRLD